MIKILLSQIHRADEMGEDNNETVDSLDNDDEIEDSEDLDDNQDSTEGDIQDSLDTEDSIDSDDTDDSVEEDDNNEQDPLDSEDSIEDDGEESESSEGKEDAEGNMTPEAKEKIVDEMKQAYDDTPKEDSGDTLVPEKSEYLKDPPIAENKNTGERYNDVNYDWPSNGGFEGKPEEVTPQPVENRGLPYHFTEENITDEPSYHSYEVDRDFGQLQDAINEYNNPALTAEENEFMRGEFQKEYDRNNWPSDEYTHELGKTYYGDIAETFDSGGGTQLELPMSVGSLKELGMIHEV